MPDDDDDMPDIDEDDITYYRHDNPDNEKPDIAEDSYDDDMPDINPNDISFFRHSNPNNTSPQIDPNQIPFFSTSSRQPKLKIPSFDELGLSDSQKQDIYRELPKFFAEGNFSIKVENKKFKAEKGLVIELFNRSGVIVNDKRIKEDGKILTIIWIGLFKATSFDNLVRIIKHYSGKSEDKIRYDVIDITLDFEEITGIKFKPYWAKNKKKRETEEFIKKKREENQKEVQSFVSNNQKNVKRDKISILKRKIREIDWDAVSNNWDVVREGSFAITEKSQHFKLNPYKDCDKDSNPLYMHKGWLEKLYNGLGLSDRKIGKICGISHWTIGDWRKRHKIETREPKGYYITKQGYKMILMPLGYKHPHRKSRSGKQYILEHRLVMEKFLRQNPHLEASKKYLIDGKYLKSGTEVHHINQDRLDNRIENLWLYPTNQIHGLAQESLNQCLSALIKLKQITFNNGEYKFDGSFNYRNRYNEREIREITKPLEFKLPFENIDEIRDEIKKWDWDEISNNWTVYKYRGGDKQSKKSYIEYKLNPYKDCDKDSNPLYMHKGWLERVVTDKRFNLTDSRLSNLCGISIGTVQHWKQRTHKISTKYTKMGAPKYVDPDGYIVIKVPDSYKNPFVKITKVQRIPYNIIAEHRYNAERMLVRSSNLSLKSKYLLDGKYLLPKYHVHHINLDILDNRYENLWITEEHSKVHSSLRSLTKQLLDSGFLDFINGRYYL